MALLLEFGTISMNTTPEKGTCYASWKRGRGQEDMHSMVSSVVVQRVIEQRVIEQNKYMSRQS